MNLFKRLAITLSALTLTTGLLVAIGHIFTIPILLFYYEYTNDSSGLSTTSGSLLPLVVGVVVSYIAEKIYVYKSEQNLG